MGFYRRVVYPALVSRLGNPQPIQALREQIVPLARGDVVEASGAQICFTLPRLELVHTQRLACGHQLEQLLQQLRDRPREADQRGEHRDIAILESLPGVGRKVAVTMKRPKRPGMAPQNLHPCSNPGGASKIPWKITSFAQLVTLIAPASRSQMFPGTHRIQTARSISTVHEGFLAKRHTRGWRFPEPPPAYTKLPKLC
jgi:hypothetical protein